MINQNTPTCAAAFHQYTPDGYLVFDIGKGHYLTLSPTDWAAINYSTDCNPEDFPRWIFKGAHAALVAGDRPTFCAHVNDAYHMMFRLHSAVEQSVSRGWYQ